MSNTTINYKTAGDELVIKTHLNERKFAGYLYCHPEETEFSNFVIKHDISNKILNDEERYNILLEMYNSDWLHKMYEEYKIENGIKN